jgi:hypothetical protein
MHVSYFWHMNILFTTIYPDCSHAIATQKIYSTECLVFQREAFVSGRDALCSHSILTVGRLPIYSYTFSSWRNILLNHFILLTPSSFHAMLSTSRTCTG